MALRYLNLRFQDSSIKPVIVVQKHVRDDLDWFQIVRLDIWLELLREDGAQDEWLTKRLQRVSVLMFIKYSTKSSSIAGISTMCGLFSAFYYCSPSQKTRSLCYQTSILDYQQLGTSYLVRRSFFWDGKTGTCVYYSKIGRKMASRLYQIGISLWTVFFYGLGCNWLGIQVKTRVFD